MTGRQLRCLRLLPLVALAAVPAAVLLGAEPVAAAPGDVIADVSIPEVDINPDFGVAKAVAFDGQFLYYGEFAGSVLHRIDMPPPGASAATGHTDIPVTGVTGGIMTIAYDLGRDQFWTVNGDGTVIYLVTKTGTATSQFSVDQAGLPGACKQTACSSEVKIAYDRADDTIWYSPDTSRRIYHFQSAPDALGRGVLVAGNPYIDVDVPPNDMDAQCPYGSYASGIATGGSDLFVEVSACLYYFEYSKTGTRVAEIPRAFETSGGLTCDNLTYPVSVIWMRDGWNGHIYALEQPQANACAYGGGPALTSPARPPAAGARGAPRAARR